MEREKGGSAASIQNAMNTMIDALAKKQKEKEAHNKKKEMQAKREFQFNSFMKMVELYERMNNPENANEFMMKAQAILMENKEFMMKAQAILMENEAEIEGDKKPPAVEAGRKEVEKDPKDDGDDDSVNSLLEFSQRKVDEYEESQLEKECMAAMKGDDDSESDMDSFTTVKGQVPKTEMSNNDMEKILRADRRVGQQWINWIPPIDPEEEPPYFARGSPETVETWDGVNEIDEDSTASHSSAPLLED